MSEPTDVGPSTADQLFRLIRSFGYTTHGQTAEIVDAIVAKWGTPPAVAGEPVAWLDPWTGTKVTTDYDAYGKHGIPLYTVPQPMERESAEFGRFLSDVLTAAGLVTHGKQCKALGERLADMCAKLRHHGIKGGQHDPD